MKHVEKISKFVNQECVGSKSTGYVPFALDPDILGEGSVGGGGGGQACSSCPARPSRLMPNQASHSHQEIRETGGDLRSYSQTTYKPESQGFYLQLCTVVYFLGFLLHSLVFLFHGFLPNS